MDVTTFVALRETNVNDIESNELVARYAQDGYVLARGAIEQQKIDHVRDRPDR